ncbi:RNA polymerase II elongation factor ELL-like isoform X2 [Takifugu rubripes]|uniref:RNA polymerase II elongation factor ELL-like isoform X2 n=1 Tax=Takifugu rubripes TaxID=31033 RepID=UPI00114539EA|nr:RNA polymerase II elongation factor ELL-like isoform X2 [Takifugu rubripes]
MTSLRQELHYRLYCGNNHRGRSGNRTLFHVKLTDSAIRTLEAHQNLKESSLGKASICFKGNQGFNITPHIPSYSIVQQLGICTLLGRVGDCGEICEWS